LLRFSVIGTSSGQSSMTGSFSTSKARDGLPRDGLMRGAGSSS
jgi:hypothetical protein